MADQRRPKRPWWQRNYLDLPAVAWLAAGALVLYMLVMIALALILPKAGS